MPERETITIEEYRRLTTRAKRGRATRPDLPAAERSARTGLTTLLQSGWNIAWDSTMRCRLYRGEMDTGWHAEEIDACNKAKELSR